MYNPAPDRMAWVQMARGKAAVGGQTLRQGDGAALAKEQAWNFKAQETSEILIFDMFSAL
jgi:hypothetical protein